MNKPRPPKKPQPVSEDSFVRVHELRIPIEGTVAELIARLQKIPNVNTQISSTDGGDSDIVINWQTIDEEAYESDIEKYTSDLVAYREEYKKYLKAMVDYVEQGGEI